MRILIPQNSKNGGASDSTQNHLRLVSSPTSSSCSIVCLASTAAIRGSEDIGKVTTKLISLPDQCRLAELFPHCRQVPVFLRTHFLGVPARNFNLRHGSCRILGSSPGCVDFFTAVLQLGFGGPVLKHTLASFLSSFGESKYLT